jgi:hypothetical protein
MGGPRVELTGKIFGRLTVLSRGPYLYKIRNNSCWNCRCECGNEKVVSSSSLMRGLTLSCGCLHIERARIANTKHGESARGNLSPEYNTFQHAQGRCNDKNHISYKNYGGRGIEFRLKSVDDIISSIGRRPSPDHSIDRIDNDGHYEIGNIRWATRSEQMKNRRYTEKFVKASRRNMLHARKFLKGSQRPPL